jgi:hypothetical protein
MDVQINGAGGGGLERMILCSAVLNARVAPSIVLLRLVEFVCGEELAHFMEQAVLIF